MSFTDGEQTSPSERMRSETGRDYPSSTAGEPASAPSDSDGRSHTQGRPVLTSATAPVAPFSTLRMVELLLAELRDLPTPPTLLERAHLIRSW